MKLPCNEDSILLKASVVFLWCYRVVEFFPHPLQIKLTQLIVLLQSQLDIYRKVGSLLLITGLLFNLLETDVYTIEEKHDEKIPHVEKQNKKIH